MGVSSRECIAIRLRFFRSVWRTGSAKITLSVSLISSSMSSISPPWVSIAMSAAPTGRPGYHPAVLLKLFIYGYLNRIPSSRRLEREAGRNVELTWLTGRLVPTTRPSPISGARTGRLLLP